MANRRDSGRHAKRCQGMPASVRDARHRLRLPSTDVHSFLSEELSVERIDHINEHLWLAGRPYPARALNVQGVLERQIIPTTDTSLHLVWTTGKIYVRPLPTCLLSEDFYEQHLAPTSTSPIPPALGLLYSYIALLPSEFDFDIARQAHLISDAYGWDDWQKLVFRVLSDYPGPSQEGRKILDYIPLRYVYGELRLDRLDKIYRYLEGDLLHGYSPLTGSNRYGDYFRKNIAVIGASTVYLVVILSAMSLGRTTTTLKNNEAFEQACYGFAVFAIMLPLIGICLIVAVFVFMFVSNYLRTLVVQRQRHQSSHKAQKDGECIEMGGNMSDANSRNAEQV